LDTFGFSGLNGSAGDGSLQSIKDTGHRYNYNDPGGRGSALVAPNTTMNIGVTGNVELNSNWSAYTNILANHREGTLYFTPLPITGASGRFTDLIQVPFDNPNLPADAAEAIRAELGPDVDAFQMWWRSADLGNRKFDYDTDTLQATVGFTGDFDFLQENPHVVRLMTWWHANEGWRRGLPIASGDVCHKPTDIGIQRIQQALPISYRLRDLKRRQVVRIKDATTYDITQCESVDGGLQDL